VLPFANLSQDPSQEYFSDGVTEDLITGLSKVSGLFVIARNSVFTYKGKAVKVRDVGRELGVRYVLEGGVQRSGSRVRITAQLVDATTGYHIWAERYDREVNDISRSKTRSRSGSSARWRSSSPRRRSGVSAGRRPATRRRTTRATRPRGAPRTTRDGNAEARRLFVKALDLDPNYAAAYLGLAWTHLQSWQFMWSTDREGLERARELAERAIALNESLVGAHHVLGQIYLWMKQHDRAIAEAEQAVALAPNDADGYETLAETLCWSGRPEECIQAIRTRCASIRTTRTSTMDTGPRLLLDRQRRQALDSFARRLKANPNFLPAHAYRAVLFTELGRMNGSA
jgi:adenylate cyclase